MKKLQIDLKIPDPFKSNMFWVKVQHRTKVTGFKFVRDNITDLVKRAQSPDRGLVGRVLHSLGARMNPRTRGVYEDLRLIDASFIRLILNLRLDCRGLHSVDPELLKKVINLHALQMDRLIQAAYDRANEHIKAGEL